MLDSASHVSGGTQGGEPPDGELAIVLDDVGFKAGSTHILRHVSLALGRGGRTVLIGPNGSGKTTLLRLAMGLIAPSSGSVSLEGAAIDAANRAIVFQKPVMLRRTAAANIAYALKVAGKPADAREIQRLLDLTQLSSLAGRPARRLSGGEQQRLALARALAREPRVLFLDEPTASLDPAATKLVEEIIARVCESGVQIVMSTHDLGQARRLAHEIIFIANGRVVEQVPATNFFSSPSSEEARRFLAGDLVI
jgi:tungstate transport system ATP-binding protein